MLCTALPASQYTATTAVDTFLFLGLAIPAQAGVTALTALLTEVAGVSRGAHKKVITWINMI